MIGMMADSYDSEGAWWLSGIMDFFLEGIPNYYLAIAAGAHNLVASERHWQEVSKCLMSFWSTLMG